MTERRTYSYLGPAGTFTEAALDQVPEARGHDWKPVHNVGEALADVLEGRSHAAMIAIENSIEGGVSTTLDALATLPGLRIIGEYLVKVNFVLVGKPGTRLEDVDVIAAHPVAYAQCHGWLGEHLPRHAHVPAASNVASALGVLDGSSPAQAAIAAPGIVQHHDVEVLAEQIGDNENAVTRFVLVSKPAKPGEPTGADKTSLIVELPDDRPGALLDMLEQFSTRASTCRSCSPVRSETRSAGTASWWMPTGTPTTSAWPTRCWASAGSALTWSSWARTPAQTARSCTTPSATPTACSSRRATGCAP